MSDTSESHQDHSAAAQTAGIGIPAIVAVVSGMAAAWIAAGSIGLLGHPLRHALSWLALAVAVVAAWPPRGTGLGACLILAISAAVGAIMSTSLVPAVHVLAVALVLAALAQANRGLTARALLLGAVGAVVLGLFTLACTSAPAVWLAADAAGRALGWTASRISGEPLWIGPTFAGLDFLVVMAALFAGWLLVTAPPRLVRAICAAAAILAAHLIYLVVLAFHDELIAALPEIVYPEPAEKSLLGVWAWGNAARTMLPWSLPAIAAVLHAAVLAAMFRWATWLPVAGPDAQPAASRAEEEPGRGSRTAEALLLFGPLLLAAVIPLVSVLAVSRSDLKGKTILAYEKGFLDWEKPQYDAQSAGMYGALPMLVESLGGRFQSSAELSSKELAQAHVLLLVHPNQPWTEPQLERVWQSVSRGGLSLLVVAEPRVHEGELESTFNDVLRPTAMQVEYDTAISRTGNWEHATLAMAHPTTAGLDDRRNWFGLLMGSSIRTGWPARPLLVGRFGWSDPGSDAALSGMFQYRSGERLGDLVLAAEQRLGRGRVVVLGDASSLHNEMIGESYRFVGRILGYLAGRSGSPQAWWRQAVGLFCIVALLGLLCWRATPRRLAMTVVVLAISLTAATALTHHLSRVLPDGRTHSPNKLAYIDASHLEAYSSDTWSEDGVAGLRRTLMRSGYLPLLLPGLSRERLERAGLLISIGPARRFSHGQRETVREFVRDGGTLLSMVGAEEAAASARLLADFDFLVPPSPVPPSGDSREPEPMGCFRTSYLDLGEYRTYVQFFAGWPIEHPAKDTRVLTRGFHNLPIIASRSFGAGKVVLIGDTFMAVNQNLESVDQDLPENIVFWRWLLSLITKREPWIPPKPNPPAETSGGEVAP